MSKNLRDDILNACRGYERDHIIDTLKGILNENTSTSVFKIAEELYGEDYQYSLNSEEVFELIEALTRYGKLTSRDRRFDRRQESDVIVSEMADVVICIFQLLHTRRISPDVLNHVMKNKLERLCTSESVRTAILGLSRSVDRMTHIVNAPTVEDDSVKP